MFVPYRCCACSCRDRVVQVLRSQFHTRSCRGCFVITSSSCRLRRTGVVFAFVLMLCSCRAGAVLAFSRSVVSWMFRARVGLVPFA